MPGKTSHPPKLPMWQRLAAFCSFLALAAALLAPSAALAEEVRTGKLGGLCAVTTAAQSADAGDMLLASSHCDSCSSLAFALPHFAAQSLPSKPGQRVVGASLPFGLATLVEGLPPSCGPPLL